MHASKWVTAIGLFLSMFLGAWWVNEKNERVYHSEEMIQIQEVDVMVHEPFKPREYIKIR